MNTPVDPNFIIRGSTLHGLVSMVIHTEDTVKTMILFGGRLDRYISLSRLSVTRQIKVYGLLSDFSRAVYMQINVDCFCLPI